MDIQDERQVVVDRAKKLFGDRQNFKEFCDLFYAVMADSNRIVWTDIVTEKNQ